MFAYMKNCQLWWRMEFTSYYTIRWVYYTIATFEF